MPGKPSKVRSTTRVRITAAVLQIVQGAEVAPTRAGLVTATPLAEIEMITLSQENSAVPAGDTGLEHRRSEGGESKLRFAARV
jgi:hypothetical protein